VLLTVGLLALSAGPLFPQQPSRLEELEKKIERLRRELADAEAREAQLARQQGDTQTLLKQLGTQIVKSEQLLNALAQQIRNNTREAERLQGEIAQLEARIGRLQGAVAAYLVDLYQHGRRRSWELVLGSESFTEGVRRLKGITVVAARQRRDVDRIFLGLGRVADGAARNEPDRALAQVRCEPIDELPRRLEPVAGVHAAGDDDRLVALQAGDLVRIVHHGVMTFRDERVADPLRDLLRGAVLGRDRDQDFHRLDLLSGSSRWWPAVRRGR